MDDITISREALRRQFAEGFKLRTPDEAQAFFCALDFSAACAESLGGEVGRLYGALRSSMAAAWQDFVAEVAH